MSTLPCFAYIVLGESGEDAFDIHPGKINKRLLKIMLYKHV